MTSVLSILIGCLFAGPAFLIPAYNLVLIVARLCGANARVSQCVEPTHTFAILIPAHNEEKTLAKTLSSCAALEYPGDMHETFVVADNCMDATAHIAREYNVVCYERNDPVRHGKGHALRFGFERVLAEAFDAIVVLDADCQIDEHALRVLDRCLSDESHVIQLNHITTNCDESPSSYVARVGQYLEYDFAYAPKSSFHLAVPLVGTGMVFHRSVLEQVPWDVVSLVEDIEYTVRLAKRGTRVQFVSNVAVRHSSESRLEQLRVQRGRWAEGTLRISRVKGGQLLVSGLLRGRLLLADLGWTLLTMSRPLILMHLALAICIAGAFAWYADDRTSHVLLGVTGVAFLSQIAYYLFGILMLGVSRHRLVLLLSAPWVVVRLAMISLTSLLSTTESQWHRTPR